MHEAGIAAGILQAVVATAERAGAERVNQVDVTVGVLTEVLEEALQFAWGAATPGTLAEGAVLAITMVPAWTRCVDCGHEFGHDRYGGRQCPACQGYVVKLLTGRELEVDGIDID